jgi:radical SAM superfamily enzyme YgiQ (UPF0313 family)
MGTGLRQYIGSAGIFRDSSQGSRTRSDDHPLVFGGGPVLTANPEPFADFFDVILLGDGENLLGDFIDAYKDVRHG